MNNLLKRVASSALLGSLWLIPMARATAAEARPPAVVNEPAPATPAPSTFAELFPFGAVAAAGTLGELQATPSDDSAYAAREQQATALQDFRGGAVYVYLGSTALLVAIIILIILLV
jgi:hypothetical protein